jgi:hypothetical protein
MALTTPMVAGLAFRERLEQLPAEFHATLRPEPDSAYNPRAIAVVGPTGKVGYVAPELARDLYARVAGGEVVSCLVRRGRYSSTTGILAMLDI